jgi:sugar-specific transcriptional regulator TrmB
MDPPLVSFEERGTDSKKDVPVSANISSDPFTRIISEPDEIISTIYSISRRASSDPISAFYFGMMDSRGPETAVQPEFFKILQSVKKENPNEKIHFIIDIQQENLNSVKKLIDTGYEARHIGGLKGSFGITRTDYLYFIGGGAYGKLPKQMVWSTNAVLLEQMKNVFDNLWVGAIPAESRISEIENEMTGTTSPRIEVSSNPFEIEEKFRELVNSAASEIQIVFPTQASFLREEIIGVNEALDRASIDRGVKIRMLSPVDNVVKDKISSHRWTLTSEIGPDRGGNPSRQIMIREIDVASIEAQITFAIFDRSRSFIIELKDNSKLEFEKRSEERRVGKEC